MTFFLPRKSCRATFLRSLPSKYCSVKSGATLPTFSPGMAGLTGVSPKTAELVSRNRRVAAKAGLRMISPFPEGWGSAGPLLKLRWALIEGQSQDKGGVERYIAYGHRSQYIARNDSDGQWAVLPRG